jgi:hypothetical protein
LVRATNPACLPVIDVAPSVHIPMQRDQYIRFQQSRHLWDWVYLLQWYVLSMDGKIAVILRLYRYLLWCISQKLTK